ncbi:MAG: hypothetical protein K6F63_01905 [Lachnospiraceae bacterium]|nr:hypothetical protein [Lachnospiraceae bacterium]
MTEGSNVFGRYRQWVRRGLLEICPYEEKELGSKTGKIVFISFSAAVLGAGTVLLVNGSDLFTFLAMVFIAYIMLREIPEFLLTKKRNEFYAILPAYLSAVRRKYVSLGNIPEAVKEAAAGMEKEIRLNAKEICEILMLGNRREPVREYAGKGIRDRFMKLFLIQAYEASEFGDGKGEKESSVFAENMEILRNGIANERYSSRKTAFMFSGYMTVSVLPVLVFGVIKRAGLSFSGDLIEFYEGKGKLVLLAALLTSFFIYRMISDAGSDGRKKGLGYGRKTEGKIAGKLECNKGAVCNLIRRLISETDPDDTVAGTVLEMVMAMAVPTVIGIASGAAMLPGGKFALGVMSMISGIMPVIELLYRQERSNKLMIEEIKRMQMVIMMERKLESITVVALLSDLELFANAFGSEIRECLNTWSEGPEEALKVLKKKGGKKNAYFNAIAEGFLAVDEVGLEEAFSDTISDRDSMEKFEELENDIRTEKRRDLTDIMAWIPGAVMLGGYFIIPFLKLTLGEMEELFKMLESF